MKKKKESEKILKGRKKGRKDMRQKNNDSCFVEVMKKEKNGREDFIRREEGRKGKIDKIRTSSLASP